MLQDKWIEFAIELQSLAQAGLTYGKDVYDLEWYARIHKIAVQDRNKHNDLPYAYGIVKVFILCEAACGSFVPNSETTETRYFGKNEIPADLAVEKTNREQIQMCFKANEAEYWETLFDQGKRS